MADEKKIDPTNEPTPKLPEQPPVHKPAPALSPAPPAPAPAPTPVAKPEPPAPAPPAPPKPAPPAPKPQPIAPIADRIRDVQNWPLAKQGVLPIEHSRRPSYMLHKGFLLASDILSGKVVVYDGNGKDEKDVTDAPNLRQEQHSSVEALVQTGWEIA